MMIEEVILVDDFDVQIGTMEKMKAHEQALLHRAFSVFIFDEEGKMLLQQRALTKYHSAGLWTNACCSHPRPGENTIDAATRRLMEEMGFTTPIKKILHFTYQVKFDNGLTEHEYDHVFVGIYNGQIKLNKSEVHDYTFKSMPTIQEELQHHPHQYTEWFKIVFPKVMDWWQNQNFS